MRDDFSGSVKRTVSNRVNMHCSNPECFTVTSGPQIDPSKSINIGVAAHISAASKGGPRYDASLSPEERKHATNAIWLCQNCAKSVDDDQKRFTKDILMKWKHSAEISALSLLGKTATTIDSNLSNLIPEEIDILCAAAEKGEIHLFEVDEASPWIMVNSERLADESDPACAAAYYDALYSLINRGLARYDGGILYVLRNKGFKLGRALKAARFDSSDNTV